MATLTVRLGNHIFFICFLKNHMTWFGKKFTLILTPSTEISRFLSVFSKDDFKSENNQFETVFILKFRSGKKFPIKRKKMKKYKSVKMHRGP